MFPRLWRSMWFAPADRPILLRTKSRPQGFVAERGGPFPGGDDEDCWAWVADADAAPASWTDGVCWAVNEDGVPSERPTGWRNIDAKES